MSKAIPTSRGRSRRARRGFLMLDILSGLLLMVAVVVMLVSVMGRQRLAASHLADERAAARLAEEAILERTMDHAAATSAPTSTPTTMPATAPVQAQAQAGDPDTTDVRFVAIDDAPAPKGLHWMRVTARVNGRSATLSALLPIDAEGTR